MSTGIAALEFEKVSKSYGSKTVLNEISLSMLEGEYVGLVGVNGAGKTTLIKCLLNFCALDSGQIRIFGSDHRENNARHALTFLPEKFVPPYFLRGLDFLKYMSALHQVEYDAARVRGLLATLDLAEAALAQPVYEYSKGMAQKLGLVASLMIKRKLLVYDEPMSGLDPRARARLKEYLLSLKDRRLSLFYSTHLLEDIESMCDRLVILHQGRIYFSGTLPECLEKYNAPSLERAYLNCVEQ